MEEEQVEAGTDRDRPVINAARWLVVGPGVKMAGACGPVGGIATARPRTRQSQSKICSRSRARAS